MHKERVKRQREKTERRENGVMQRNSVRVDREDREIERKTSRVGKVSLIPYTGRPILRGTERKGAL